MNELNALYWEERYASGNTGWDLGEISPPLKAYFDQLKNKDIEILIPGAGNAYEAAYLHENGFSNVYLLDWAKLPLQHFQERFPKFPNTHVLCADFFKHSGEYDLIVEQTFFCALEPRFRNAYCQKTYQLLKPAGKLMGVLFQIPLNRDNPPFGGDRDEYADCFSPYFNFKIFETCYNSHPDRQGSELFILLEKKDTYVKD